MEKLKITGGARIGGVNATWPLATLIVEEDKLELNASLLGNLVFSPEDVISLELNSSVFSNGLVIKHKIGEYSKKVLFWNIGSSEKLISRIKQTGFLDKGSINPSVLAEIRRKQEQGGYPFKKLPGYIVFGIYVISGLTILLDSPFEFQGKLITISDYAFLIQSGMGIILSLSILLLEPMRDWLLKEGREIKDIKSIVLFILLVSGLIFSVSIRRL